MDSAELTEWFAFESIEPWGSQIDCLLAADQQALLANCNRDSKTRPRPYTQKDFLREFDKEPPKRKRQSVKSQIAIVKSALGKK